MRRNMEELRVKVDCCLPATTIHAISHITFPAFDFTIVSYMRLLFQLQGQYCFLLTTKQWIIYAFIWNYALWAVYLNCSPCYVAFGDRHFSLAERRRVEETSANMSCPKTLILLNSVYTNGVLNARSCVETPVILHSENERKRRRVPSWVKVVA